MPDRKPSAIIRDILQSIEHIQLYTTDLSYENFTHHFMAVEACLYNIQVIGEAVSQLPAHIKESEPSIPWALMKAMRNRLIHEYFGTDLALVWNVIKNELPAYKQTFEKIHAALLANET